MIKFGAYYGTNMVLYPEFFLDLGYNGVTHIRGVNKNTKALRNNGSGKSLLLSGISDVMMGCSPILEPNDSRAKKDLYTGGTSISVEVDGNTITKRTKGTTVSYEIPTESGSELVKIDVARNYLYEVFPISVEEFFTYVYLDSRRTFKLHMGTTTERNRVFTQLFRLDNFTELHQHFSGLLSELNYKRRELSSLVTQLHELGEPTDCSKDKALHKKAVAKLATLQQRLKDSKAAEAKARSAREHNKKVEERTKLLAKLDLVDGTGVLGLTQKAARRLEAEWVAYDNYKSKRSSIVGDIPDASEIEGLTAELAKLKRKVALGVSEVDTVAMAKELGVTLKELPDKLSHMESNIHVIRHLSQPQDECPACGGAYSSKLVSKFAKLLKSEQREYEKLDRLAKAVELYGSGITKAEYNATRSRVSEIERLLQNFERHKVVAELKCAKPDKARDYYDTTLAVATRLNSLLPYDSVIDVPEVEPFDKLVDRIDVANDFILEVKGRLLKEKFSGSQRKALQDKIDSLEAELEDYEVVKALVDAYGSKGIKTLAIADICNRLQNNLNNFSFSVFPEPIYFSIVVEPNRFDILATRNPGTEFEQTSDVRLLSGGESRSFNLLMLISILPLIPDKIRTNIVVLDEMTANMDSTTKHLVYATYIPLLQEQVPHVIVLDTGTTPIDDAREMYVVKEGNTSKLIGEE